MRRRRASRRPGCERRTAGERLKPLESPSPVLAQAGCTPDDNRQGWERLHELVDTAQTVDKNPTIEAKDVPTAAERRAALTDLYAWFTCQGAPTGPRVLEMGFARYDRSFKLPGRF